MIWGSPFGYILPESAGNVFHAFLFSHSRHISSIRGELVPYLVRKQFSKTSNRQTAKDDAEDQKQQLKKSDISTNHGRCLLSFLVFMYNLKQKKIQIRKKNPQYPLSVMWSHGAASVSVSLRAPDLVTRRASPPAGPGALVLERPPRWHERGLPRREAPLLRARHGWGPVLPGQHPSRLHWGEPTGECVIKEKPRL